MNEHTPYDSRTARDGESGREFAPEATATDAAASNISLESLLHAASRWWPVAAPLGLLLAVVTGAVVWYWFEPKYRAAAFLRVEEQRPYVAFEPAKDARLFVETQVQLIRSPLILSKVISQGSIAQMPEVQRQQYPLTWLGERLNVRTVGKSELLEISFDGPDPNNAATIANAAMEAYLELYADQSTERTDLIIRLLEQERENRLAELERLRERVRVIARETVGHDVPLVGDGRNTLVVQNPLASLEEQLTSVEVERHLREAQLAAARTLIESGELAVPPARLEELLAQRPELQELRQRLAERRALAAEYARLSPRGERDAGVQRIALEIERLEQQLEETSESLRPQVASQLDGLLAAEHAQQLAEQQAEVEGYRLMEKLLRERLDTQRAELERRGDHSLTLEFARGELVRAEEVFRRIADRIAVLRTERQAPAQASLLQRAVPPEAPLRGIPVLQMIGGSTAAFAMPFLLAVWWERRQRRIADSEQLRDVVPLDVLGEITTLPVRPVRRGRRTEQAFQWQRSLYLESINLLRSNLLVQRGSCEARVVMISSAASGEGKSSLAAELALSLTRTTHEPTLLIDADLRAPDLHETFSVPLDPGLAGVLAGTCRFDDALVRGWCQHLDVLPAGHTPACPDELLSDARLVSVVDEARSRYRYVVIDAPPVLVAGETLFLAKVADGTLLCTMRDVSRAPAVQLACQRLGAAGVRLLGTVLSGVPISRYANRYGGYHSYLRRYARSVAEHHDGSTPSNGAGGHPAPGEHNTESASVATAIATATDQPHENGDGQVSF